MKMGGRQELEGKQFVDSGPAEMAWLPTLVPGRPDQPNLPQVHVQGPFQLFPPWRPDLNPTRDDKT